MGYRELPNVGGGVLPDVSSRRSDVPDQDQRKYYEYYRYGLVVVAGNIDELTGQ